MKLSEFEKLSTSDADDSDVIVSAVVSASDDEVDESRNLDLLYAKDSTSALPLDDPEDNWPPVSWEVFADWLPFFDLGVPGALSLFFEWWDSAFVIGFVLTDC